MSRHPSGEHEIRRLAASLIQEHGANEAARKLGLSRITVLSLAAGAPVLTATFALVRERMTASGDAR